MAAPSQQRGGGQGGRGGGRGGGGRGGNRGGGRSGRGGHNGPTTSSPLELPVVSDCTYIDTHVHLEYILEKVAQKNAKRPESSSNSEMPMERILDTYPAHANFEACIAVFCDASALSPSLATWPEFLLDPRVYGAFGLHPHTSQHYNDALEARIKEALQHEKAVAWGECGLDFAKMHSEKDIQMSVFARQIKAAVSIGKPIMVHSRKAAQETYDILVNNAPADHPIHVHCFSDEVENATKLLQHFSRLVCSLLPSFSCLSRHVFALTACFSTSTSVLLA